MPKKPCAYVLLAGVLTTLSGCQMIPVQNLQQDQFRLLSYQQETAKGTDSVLKMCGERLPANSNVGFFGVNSFSGFGEFKSHFNQQSPIVSQPKVKHQAGQHKILVRAAVSENYSKPGEVAYVYLDGDFEPKKSYQLKFTQSDKHVKVWAEDAETQQTIAGPVIQSFQPGHYWRKLGDMCRFTTI